MRVLSDETVSNSGCVSLYTHMYALVHICVYVWACVTARVSVWCVCDYFKTIHKEELFYDFCVSLRTGKHSDEFNINNLSHAESFRWGWRSQTEILKDKHELNRWKLWYLFFNLMMLALHPPKHKRTIYIYIYIYILSSTDRLFRCITTPQCS